VPRALSYLCLVALFAGQETGDAVTKQTERDAVTKQTCFAVISALWLYLLLGLLCHCLSLCSVFFVTVSFAHCLWLTRSDMAWCHMVIPPITCSAITCSGITSPVADKERHGDMWYDMPCYHMVICGINHICYQCSAITCSYVLSHGDMWCHMVTSGLRW